MRHSDGSLDVTKVVLSVLTAVSTLVATGAVRWVWVMETRVVALELTVARLEKDVAIALQPEAGPDMSAIWRRLGANRDHVNYLRSQHGLGPVEDR